MRFLATLALALALITGFSGAKAQTYFREGTTQWLDHSSGSATATTTAIGAQYSHVRLVSTTAVYYALALSGSRTRAGRTAGKLREAMAWSIRFWSASVWLTHSHRISRAVSLRAT